MSESPVALVTGSAKRVGKVVARELGERGYRLAIHYNRSEADARATIAEFAEQGFEAESFRADVGEEQAVRDLIASVVERFGRLDVLVCSASTWLRKPLVDTASADVFGEFAANAAGPFFCCRYGGMVMANQAEGGSIVTIGDWAIQRPYLDHAAYFLSKGAIPTLTRTMAVELARRNPRVRVNCILPGPVLLPADLPEEERQQAIEGTLVRREGSPQHVAHAVRFLIENDFVTGVCLPVDGGRSIRGD